MSGAKVGAKERMLRVENKTCQENSSSFRCEKKKIYKRSHEFDFTSQNWAELNAGPDRRGGEYSEEGSGSRGAERSQTQIDTYK